MFSPCTSGFPISYPGSVQKHLVDRLATLNCSQVRMSVCTCVCVGGICVRRVPCDRLVSQGVLLSGIVSKFTVTLNQDKVLTEELMNE